MDEVSNSSILQEMSGLFQKSCCRQSVGRMRSLSIGFGVRIPHLKKNLPDSFYGEWELGTYTSAWRIVRQRHVLCGSQNVVDSIAELDAGLNSIELGQVVSVCAISELDVRVDLDDGTRVEFLGASSGEDELFHVFGPNNLYVEYSMTKGWRIGKSNVPWA